MRLFVIKQRSTYGHKIEFAKQTIISTILHIHFTNFEFQTFTKLALNISKIKWLFYRIGEHLHGSLVVVVEDKRGEFERRYVCKSVDPRRSPNEQIFEFLISDTRLTYKNEKLFEEQKTGNYN